MNRLQNIDGCYSYFLLIASNYLDSKKNVRGDALKTIADTVNKEYEDANIQAYDVKEIWVETQEYWKVWAEVLKIVDPDCVDCILGRITPHHPREWETILKKVPDAVKFKAGNFPCAGQVHAIFFESTAQNSKKIKKKRSEEASSSADLMREEKEQIKELMDSIDKVSKLKKSLEHVLFCTMFFENKKSREAYKACTSDAQRFKFVDDEYKKYKERLEQP